MNIIEGTVIKYIKRHELDPIKHLTIGKCYTVTSVQFDKKGEFSAIMIGCDFGPGHSVYKFHFPDYFKIVQKELPKNSRTI
jgi:hypothetical protein